LAQFLDGQIGRGLQYGKDHLLVLLDPAGSAIATDRHRPSITLLAVALPPAAHARRAHVEPLTGFAVAQPLRHCRKNTNPKIER
jgi:hypothetical protein